MLPYRVYIGLNLFLCTTVTFMYRTCFTLALRDMVSTPRDPDEDFIVAEVTRFNWNSDEQIYLISAYYMGYIVSNLTGGLLAERFGPKRIISLILLFMFVSFAAIPFVADEIGYQYLFVLRVLQGSIEGPIYPAVQHMIAFWAPPSEKGRFVSAFAGSSFGSMIGHGIVGLSAEYFTWYWSFYFCSLLGLLVWMSWAVMVTDRPDLNRRVSDKERNYIEKSIGQLVNKDSKEIPVWTIVKSRPVWALVILNFGSMFTNYYQMNSLPTFYNEVLGFPVQEIAIIYSVSSLVRLVTGLSFSYLGDVLTTTDAMDVPTQRKFFCIFSHFIPGVILLCMCYLINHPVYSAALDLFNTALMGSINLTVNQNSQDLSPNFASTVYGIVNFTGSIGGFLTLFSLATLTKYNDSVEAAWIEMFVLCAGLLFLGAIVFLFWGSGQTQKWNEPVIIVRENKDTEAPHLANY